MIWKTIEGFPRYEINEKGTVRRKGFVQLVEKQYDYHGLKSPHKIRYWRKVKIKELKLIQGVYYDLWENKLPYRKRADILVLDHFGIKIDLKSGRNK